MIRHFRHSDPAGADTIWSISALEPRIGKLVPMFGAAGRKSMLQHLLRSLVVIDSIHVRQNRLAMLRALYGTLIPGGVGNHA